MNSPQFSNIISNSFWNILASIVLRGNIFLVNIVIARLIGVELFGKYALIKSTIQVFELSLGIAFGLSMTKFISEYKYNPQSSTINIQRIVKTNLFSSTVLSILLFLALELSSNYFSSNVLNNKELLTIFRISVFYILFNNIVQCFIGILKGEEKFKRIFQLSLLTGFLNLLTVTVLTIFFSLEGAVIAFVIFSIIQLLAYITVTFKTTNYIKRTNWQRLNLDFKVISKFNIPAIVSGLAAPPAIWYINLSLSKTEMGYQELAFFNSAYQIFALIVFLPVALSDATFPILNKYLNDAGAFKKIFTLNFLVILGISVGIGIIPFFFSDLVISIFGEDFKSGALALKFLTIAAIFSSLLTYLGKFLATINRMWLNMTFNYLWAILVTIFAITFINEGAVGVAKAFVFSYLILFIIQLTYSIYKIRTKL